mgnify:CR=1 FL=1
MPNTSTGWATAVAVIGLPFTIASGVVAMVMYAEREPPTKSTSSPAVPDVGEQAPLTLWGGPTIMFALVMGAAEHVQEDGELLGGGGPGGQMADDPDDLSLCREDPDACEFLWIDELYEADMEMEAARRQIDETVATTKGSQCRREQTELCLRAGVDVSSAAGFCTENAANREMRCQPCGGLEVYCDSIVAGDGMAALASAGGQ